MYHSGIIELLRNFSTLFWCNCKPIPGLISFFTSNLETSYEYSNALKVIHGLPPSTRPTLWDLHKNVAENKTTHPNSPHRWIPRPAGSNLSYGAKLDISCRNLWSPLAKALFDVRIYNPQTESNWSMGLEYYKWRRRQWQQQWRVYI